MDTTAIDLASRHAASPLRWRATGSLDCACGRRKNTDRPGKSFRHRSGLELLQWLMSLAILLLMPKCPLCLAAYAALATGIGLSLTVATCLRTSLLMMGGLSLALLTLRLIARWRQRARVRLPR